MRFISLKSSLNKNENYSQRYPWKTNPQSDLVVVCLPQVLEVWPQIYGRDNNWSRHISLLHAWKRASNQLKAYVWLDLESNLDLLNLRTLQYHKITETVPPSLIPLMYMLVYKSYPGVVAKIKYLYSVMDSDGILSNSSPVTDTFTSLPRLNNWKIN